MIYVSYESTNVEPFKHIDSFEWSYIYMVGNDIKYIGKYFMKQQVRKVSL